MSTFAPSAHQRPTDSLTKWRALSRLRPAALLILRVSKSPSQSLISFAADAGRAVPDAVRAVPDAVRAVPWGAWGGLGRIFGK